MKTFLLLLAFGPAVRDLAADDPAVRDAAEARLLLWGDLAWPVLDREFPDAERRRRARRVMAAVFGPSEPLLTLLDSGCVLEWHDNENGNHYHAPVQRNPSHLLAYQRLSDRRHAAGDPVRMVCRWYCDRCQNHVEFQNWYRTKEAASAGALLMRDLRAVGVPPALIRRLAFHLDDRFADAMKIPPRCP